MAFFGGSTGVIYRQFSITIVSAMGLSVLVALIFTPALCATMLKPLKKGEHHTAKGGFFGWFNRNFDRSVNGYERSVGTILRNKIPFLLGYALIVVGMIWLFTRIPTAFLPEEDQGVLFAQVQTPAGSSAERTQVVVDQMREYLLKEEADTVASVFTVNGFNFAGRGQSSGMAFIMLKPWGERSKENSVFALAERAQQHFFTFRDAMVFAFAPPAVLELGNATGFDVFLQDRGGVGHAKLMEARNQFLAKAAQSKILSAVRPNGLNDEPQYQLTIDDERASALGVTIADINNTLSIALGASYVNDFIDRGRVKKVYIQGEPNARMSRKTCRSGTCATVQAKWFRSPPSPRASGHTVRPSCPVTTASRRWKSWVLRPRATVPVMPWPKWNASRASCRTVSASPGPACLTRKNSPARRCRHCSPSLYCSCSCAWLHCMKAGRSRLPSCWSYRWVSSVH